MSATIFRKATKKWTCKDGRRVRICDMDDRHLLNTIRMLERAHHAQLCNAYQCASMLQGEQATYAAESAIAEMEEMESGHPLFEDLEQERLRRGLAKFQ